MAVIPKYLMVITWRREGKTYQEIANELGVSRQRAWEIHQRALKRISLAMPSHNHARQARQAV